MPGAEPAVGVDGVTAATVRARWMGRSLVVEVEGRLRPDTSLDSAEAIGQQVEAAVHDAVPAARRLQWIGRPGAED